MILTNLSDEQLRAVKQDGHVLLTACPGSGKTRVIIRKLGYEILKIDKDSRKKVVALTFTVRASEEIFKRLGTMGIDSDRIWSGTLHSFCLEWILRPHSGYLEELKRGFSIADSAYCQDILETYSSELKTAKRLKFLGPINMRFKRNGTFLETRPNELEVLERYHATLAEKKLIDFEILLYYSYKILRAYPKIASNLSSLFTLICVDEYQDTQDLLYAIISIIVNAGNGKTSLFLVGDTDQAIYDSLGGVAKNAGEIRAEINGQPLTSLSLSGNYRSNQRIIDFYSNFQTQKIEIVALGHYAKKKSVISFNEEINAKDIVSEIAKLIQMSLDQGIPENEICVLVPQWWLITSVSKKLRAVLPEVNFDASGLAPMSRNKDNIWYKLSRLFLTSPNPKIYSLRYRWAEEMIEEFQNYTHTNFNSLYNTPRNLLRLVNSIKSKQTEGIDYIVECFEQFLRAVKIDYLKYALLVESWDLYFESIEKRLSDKEFKIPSDIASFKSFYREMSGVTINTCVGVKGEEFETVIAYGLLNGYVPHWNEIFANRGADASRKLLYVICSRAKTNLHLISEQGRVTKAEKELITNSELAAIEYEYDPI